MSKFQVQINFKFQSSNERYFGIDAFDIDLKFGFWHLKFMVLDYVR